MKRVLTIAASVLLVALVGIQFYRPEKNIATAPPPHPIDAVLPVPADVHAILQRACYNCHSNTTAYPWYSEIQPVGWFLAGHVKDGKHDLNFDEFGGYRLMRQYRRLKQISDLAEEGKMPLPSYLIIHKEAVLSDADKQVLSSWTSAMRDSMKVKYPIDSLERKPSQGGQGQPGPGRM
jgi:hypothetical protein